MTFGIQQMTIRGFRTIRELDDFRPGNLNILIGPNGAGKSNLISFFRLMSWMLTSPGNLQEHIAALGGANALLFNGAEVTREIQARFLFHTENGENEYEVWLSHAAGDILIFTNERFRYSQFNHPSQQKAGWTELEAGHKEARIIRKADEGDKTARVICDLMRNWKVYQFHNTSMTARMRQKWRLDDNRFLKEDGANLAPVLLRIQEEEPHVYTRITEHLRLILPFFADFDLEPDTYGSTMLRWTERYNDMLFTADQAADGMLRCIALTTLLCGPPRALPGVLMLDEPELGLHPYAISVIAGLIKSLSQHVQVFIATQSTALLDYFDPTDIVVVDRTRGESRFAHLEADRLDTWLEDYSVSELWEKNVLGGRP